MLGVDRLDTSKGIPQKILAFEKFLEENPNWHDQVVLIQIAVPTRTDFPECKLFSINVWCVFACIDIILLIITRYNVICIFINLLLDGSY